ncbi:MAG: hypothetical protein ACE5I3_04700 [Phycisphaerae bacterium]
MVLLVSSGCGILPLPSDVASLIEGSLEATESSIVASVTATEAGTGLPTTLSGTVSGQYEGTYEEEILEVFFDSTGAPIAAISRSQFIVDSPAQGTLISLNLIVVVDIIVLTDESGAPVLDEQGAPVVSGLQTSATGEIIHGTGIFEDATGDLHAESVLSFLGGDFEMGSLESDLVITLDAAAAG